MKAKKIIAPDMRQALKMVRDQMGDDAVILSNRKVANGVEVTATVDYQAVVSAHRDRQRQQAHVPAFMDRDAEVSVPAGDEKRLIKQDLLAAKQEAERRLAQRDAGQRTRTATRQQSRAFQKSVLDRVKPLLGRMEQNDTAAQPAPARTTKSTPELDDDHVQLSRPARAVAAAEQQRKTPTPAKREDWKDYLDPAPRKPAATGTRHPDLAVAPASVDQQDGTAMVQMREELAQLKSLLNQQLGGVAWGDFSYRHPLSAAIFRRLTQLGLSPEIGRSLIKSVRENAPKKEAWRDALMALSKRIPLSDNNILDQHGIVAFVGPAGVGKTTTIAKLATQYALEHGAENLALITTDNYRLAGHEQLRALARILKVPLRVVTDQQPLDNVLRGLARKRMILIDTAGLSANDETFFNQLRQLEDAHTPIDKWLVLSATSQRRILERAVTQYTHLDLNGCVLTKVDESASLGEALSVIIDHQLPVSYITDGQTIPDDIKRAKAGQLVHLAVELTRDVHLDDGIMADVFQTTRHDDPAPSALLA